MANVTGTLTGTLAVPSNGGMPALNLPISMSNATSPGVTQLVNLTTTPTALTIPTGCRYVSFEGPAGNAINILIGGSGVSAGNMLICDPNNQAHIPLPSGGTTVEMACASSTITGVQVTFW